MILNYKNNQMPVLLIAIKSSKFQSKQTYTALLPALTGRITVQQIADEIAAAKSACREKIR